MVQKQINIAVKLILDPHIGRKNAITFETLRNHPSLYGSTQKQVLYAIISLRSHRKKIGSLPGVGYFIADSMSELKTTKSWITHWRQAMKHTPEGPPSLRWVC